MVRRHAGRRRADRKPGRIEVPEHGHGHGHGHGESAVDTSVVDADAIVARRVRLGVIGLLIPMIAAALVAMVILWPTGDVKVGAIENDQARGVVLSIKPCAETPADCDEATVRITEAKIKADIGQVVPAEIAKGQSAPRVEVGNKVMLSVDPKAPVTDRYSFVDNDRNAPLLLLAAIFAVAVVALSRWKGVAALLALALSGVLLLKFVLPAILRGSDPVLVAVVGGVVIMVAALYMTHGVNAHTSIALIGTIGSLGLTALVGSIFVRGSSVTGLSADAGTIFQFANQVDLVGLVAAGIVIGTLGVLDDVTVTQVTAVWELSAANPNASRWSLLSAGLRIGRAHVASVVNTLVLAYAGASLPLMMTFALGSVPASYAVSTEQVAVEVIRGLVGSLGIIAAVPLTTALAAMAVARRSPQLRSDEIEHVD
ncbi:YibE/F family protein [Kribbella sp. NBC_01245]|uniref:YibE/F family protein n=1 Tax=Kribbella sp. NBC_01245 TaxID=2903578 RepID=UPI002E2CA794|nr:YibE/F family protein [Kribbella sp. NBC_01245]